MELQKTLDEFLASLGNSEKLTIYGSLDDLNTYTEANRRNRYLGAKMKRNNQTICSLQIVEQAKYTYDRCFIVFRWFVKNRRKDPDNIAFAKKFILDSLVDCCVLENDGQKQIAGFLDIVEVDQEERVEVDIYDVE